MATDLSTGRAVSLDRGNLVKAVRSSIAVPGIFSPVETGSRILVDGGVVNNFAVDVARELGAEVIIAVYVGMSLEEDAPLSAPEVWFQAMTIGVEEHYHKQRALLGPGDVLINVPLGSARRPRARWGIG